MYVSLVVSCSGYYNRALNERENKNALYVVKGDTDVILTMASSYLCHSTMSCMRVGITSIILASSKVLYTIKFVSKFFQWIRK